MKGLKACTSKTDKNGIGQYYCSSKKSYTPWIIKSLNIALWGAGTDNKCKKSFNLTINVKILPTYKHKNNHHPLL